MEKEMKKRAAEIVLGCFLLLGVYLLSQEGARLVFQSMEARTTVIVDAGHGGKDPGKVSADGVLEKDLNLQIALKLEQHLEKEGIRVVMTRREDVMLCEEDSDNRKVQDMENRRDIIEKSGASCVISIHQNSYPEPSVSGPQVFYYENSRKGRELAEILQETLILRLQPDKTREARGNASYYMLKKISIPTVIVECGFLTCPQEAQKLGEESYQEQIAAAVCEGVVRYLKK